MEERGKGVNSYAGEVAKAVLEETMAERIWSIPCSADCHNTRSSAVEQGNFVRIIVKGTFSDQPF
jgi:hypothetical protein